MDTIRVLHRHEPGYGWSFESPDLGQGRSAASGPALDLLSAAGFLLGLRSKGI